ncbi:ferrous iron transport protein B [uncultured Tessaracoccus sp.]|uniref:ferrous iron transport protein B n=1 Tax=uncultured Tessaracoccus sp. TaxID=905023 RepID=UPI00261CF820|nr:ferrous iron transport protein B [uncultured Tessaracoccus sp.]
MTSTLRIEPVQPVVSCHCNDAGAVAPKGSPIVALVGSPNVGKSTLFNALTGARRTMGNWPGTSVEVGRGAWKGRRTYDLLDLPGAYSLDAMSPDEELTHALLLQAPEDERPDVVVVIVDAAHLSRSMYLLSQVREHRFRIVVAMTMDDVARQRGIDVDQQALSAAVGVPVVAVNPRTRTGLVELEEAVMDALDGCCATPRALPADADEFALADDRFAWIDAAVASATTQPTEAKLTNTERFDKIALHPVAGPLLFLATMWLVFQITTTVAAPLQDGLEGLVTGPITDWARAGLEAIHLPNIVTSLLVDGIIAGVGALMPFIPLMTLMFVLLAVLEDSGYMARAAVVADRTMRWIGLPGKAFLPLIVGYGCNVPAISATRVLSQRRHRIMTALLVPFTSCSARLTVYMLVASAFFPRHAGSVVFVMYLLSIVLIVLAGLLMKNTLWRTMGSEPLIMDLPPYQFPTARITASVTWTRLKGFLETATGIIVVTVAAVFVLQSIPVTGEGSFGDLEPEDSAYAAVAKTVAPVFEPAGFGTWETTGALVTGFVAKEAVISTWAQTYAVDDPEETGDDAALAAKINQAFEASSGGHKIPAVWAFLVFLLAYTPCMAVLAAQLREIGWKWTLFGVGTQLAGAWLLAVAVFQIGSLIA